MTDKEQALVATAYRLAADVCERHQVVASDAPYEIRNLTPADAEKHLRALAIKAALSVASSAYTDAEVRQIVDEVLNGHL